MMQLVKTLLLTGMALSFQACGDATEKAQHYLDSGKEFYSKGNYDKAKIEFKNALQINNNLSEAYFHLALMDEKNQNWKGMFENLSQVVKLTPDHVEGHKRLGQLLLLSGQTDKAAAEAETLLKLNSGNADAHVLKGTVLLRQGNQKAALEEADKALALASDNIDAVNLKVVAYMEGKDFVQALAVVENALTVNANDLTLNLLKLQIDMKTNKPEAVVADYQALIKLYPDKLDFQYALAKYYDEAGKDADARLILQRVIDEHPDDLKSKLVFVDYLSTKTPAEAVTVLQGYIAQQPDNAGYYLPLAKLLMSQNKWAEAKEPLNWLISNKPEDKESLAAKVFLAKIAVADKDNDSALKLVDEVLSVNAGHYDALVLRARIRLINGLTDQAVSDLRGVLRDYPKSDEAMVLLAHAYAKQNAHALADEHFRKALDLNPGNFDAVMPVVSQMIKSKDVARADEVLQKALAVKPDHAGALQALAQVRLLKKDWSGTREVADLISTKPTGDGFSKYLSGKVSEGQGLYKEAVAQYKDALAVSPGLSDALTGMLRSYEALEQRKEMLAYLDEFNKANPENTYSLILKSQLYVLDKRPDEALKLLSGSIEKWPKVTSFYEAMASIHAANQEREKAISVSQKGLESDPDNVTLRMMLANIYEQGKDYDKALENYEALISRHPNVDVAVNNLVSLLLDHYKTKENIERAVKLAARFEKSEQPYFYDTYGWALLNSDRNDEALKVFKDVVAKMPEVAVFKYHLGLAYHKKNNSSAAIAELEKALATGEKQKSFTEKEAVENLLKEIKAEKPV